ncbi:eukaryotic translation initiation factor 4B2-like isoform X2 [Malania oleifera]|uniref:eukaryotic translation initiation factor 4B2-like isoform X2 n=1 Tax=Malania oleifera TaxID=397392 RepID=UPI0025ADD397|nr:eukaryotic translation initiation factor 4B2-like isoform X2 [Malania oleifera]
MSKPWGTIGAWAAEAEAAEAEEREAAAAAADESAAAASQSFPSLKEAVSTKTKKKKMTLSEFTTGAYVGPGGAARRDSAFDYKGLTPDEMLRLPTGPKERTAEEMQSSRLGGGFSSYGRSGGPPRMRDGDNDSSWGGSRRSYGGFDEDRRAPPRVSDFDQPSRADEVDNWAMGKKSLPSLTPDSGRQNRYGSLGGGSRADEVDNWAVGKRNLPVKSNTFGSGFRDSGPEPDRWTRGGGLREIERERPRLVLDPPRGEPVVNEPLKTNRPSPFGAARPREEVLAGKGLDWKKLDSEIEAKKTSRPTSSHSSRPSSAQSSRSEGLEGGAKPRPKVNPFGDAKPREVLLEEKGKDWRKIDLELEHRAVDRSETEAEKILKEEIEQLKKEIANNNLVNTNQQSLQGSGGDQSNIHDILLCKERELEQLILDLDDKVRFGSKTTERPGSGAGRSTGFPERPPSQSGSFEESRSMEFMERPRSRGTGDVWTRPSDDRRTFLGGRDGGFLGNREMARTDRSQSRDRW